MFARAAEEARAEAERLAVAEREACLAQQQSPVAEPARAAAGRYFAAIAIGDGNGWGEARGYASQAEAEQVALGGCQQNDSGCAVQVWTNDCLAFATGANGAAGWSWGASLNEARRKALGFCNSANTCCKVTAAYCADELTQ